MTADDVRALMSAPGNDCFTWNTSLYEEHAARLIAACAPAPGARIAEAVGLRPLQVTVADRREWDLFESAANTGRGERWALARPGHPLHAEVTAAVDARRTGYYGGYRGTLGLAYLVLTA
ncbi:hypothetical protein [Streptomyces sp. NPDC058330]|uniref:hypothetical protein n=1 Tax=Streptomyces sp. NPDC058330 TaxID=3346449 RepID=UPI0036E5E434